MASTDKSRSIQFQSLVTILMPVFVAIGGFYGYVLQGEVAEAEAKMAVSMIMAPGKEDLMSVLIDLGRREPKIFKEVQCDET